MKALHPRSVFAVFAFPLAISQWTPVPIGSQRLPEVRSTDGAWVVKTDGNAGGFAFILPTPMDPSSHSVRLSWEWRVSTFPKTTPKIPFEKSSDDYAIRVGALLSDSEEDIKVPRQIEELLKDKKQKLSYVVFYCAVPSLPAGPVCAISPYNDHIVNCLVRAESKYTRVAASPIEDAMKYFKLPESERGLLKIIGVWMFADSDNSHSSSDANLRAVEVSK